MKWKEYKIGINSLSQEELQGIEKDAKEISKIILKGKIYIMHNEKYNIKIECTGKYLKMWEDRGFKIIGEEIRK
jgi:hypothetical protein